MGSDFSESRNAADSDGSRADRRVRRASAQRIMNRHMMPRRGGRRGRLSHESRPGGERRRPDSDAVMMAMNQANLCHGLVTTVTRDGKKKSCFRRAGKLLAGHPSHKAFHSFTYHRKSGGASKYARRPRQTLFYDFKGLYMYGPTCIRKGFLQFTK